jgi:acyl-CoA synthetase (AMP-forming)/AMP-acid ligase II
MATSGTTGEPKLVLHSHRSTVGGVIQAVAAEMGLTNDDVMFMPSPISHATGLQYGVRLGLALGTTVALQERWDPREAAELMHRCRASWTMGATPFLHDLLGLDEWVLDRVHESLRMFVCGGAPIPGALAERATRQLPAVSLMAAWGMSETGIVTLVRPGDPLDKVIGTDGRPVPGWEVRIVDEQGRVLGTHETGEIECRGAALFHGYYGRPDFTTDATGDGWLRTGDLGAIDDDGYLRCLGRIKDLVIRGGLNISAVEVEDHVRRHPAVRDVAVVGTPDERLGERICAVIVPDGEAPTVEELGRFLGELGLARQKHPERIIVLDALPLTPTGKVQKFLIREQLGTQAGV